MEKNGTTNKKYLGKRDFRLGVICGGLSTIPFLLCFLAAFDSRHYPRWDWMDRFGHQIEGFFDGLGLFAFVWVFVPLVIVLAISALYVKRRMPEWKDKDDQIAPIVVAFFGCALRLLLIGTVWPISVWFIGSNKIFSSSFPRPYAHIDRKSVFDALAKASSTSDISTAFAPFPTEHEGYECCKKWLKKQTRKSFTDKVRAVFVAYCFGDKEFCDSHFYGDGWVCDKKGAAQLLEMFCHNGDDPKVAAFIKRYTNSSDDEAKRAYAKEIFWNKYANDDDEVAYKFFTSLGIKPKYSDTYSYRRYRRSHHFAEYSDILYHNKASFWGVGWQFEEYETNLSRAVEKNDIKTVAKLLKWGCDPNQYLKIEAESPTIQPAMLNLLGHDIVDHLTLEGGVRSGVVKSNHIIESDHIINLVTSRAVFYLLISAGMDRTPPTSISYVNGERKISDTTDECKFS